VAYRHKRDANARNIPSPTPRRTPKAVRIAAPVAALATVGAVSVGVLAANPEQREVLAQSNAGSIGTTLDRDTTVSRSASRSMGRRSEDALNRYQQRLAEEREARATAKAVKAADTHLWTTTLLNLWTEAGDEGRKVGLVKASKKVLVTGREQAGRTELVVDGKSRWVTSGYLAEDKPEPPEPEPEVEEDSGETEPAAPSLGGECTNGTSVEGQPNVLAVHEAVCASFPEITSYGTYRSDGEHSQGIAIDIMVSGDAGWEVAEFLRANYSELGINYIMYSQKIWSVDRSSEGWRYVEDRGSATANHYDHVHVTTY
jgi:hypothetical protein